MEVVCPYPPFRNDIVSPHQLFLFDSLKMRLHDTVDSSGFPRLIQQTRPKTQIHFPSLSHTWPHATRFASCTTLLVSCTTFFISLLCRVSDDAMMVRSKRGQSFKSVAKSPEKRLYQLDSTSRLIVHGRPYWLITNARNRPLLTADPSFLSSHF